jgi:hypothetical protein
VTVARTFLVEDVERLLVFVPVLEVLEREFLLGGKRGQLLVCAWSRHSSGSRYWRARRKHW